MKKVEELGITDEEWKDSNNKKVQEAIKMYEPYFQHETGNNQEIINDKCSADIDAIVAINLKASFT